MSIFILVVQKNGPEELTFTKVIANKTLYVLIHARDCEQALHIVQTLQPDCFLLEENLPLTSGLQFHIYLHNQAGLEQVPAIVFKSLHSVIECGSVSTFAEPIPTLPHQEVLLDIINKMLLFSGRLLLYSPARN